MDEQDLRCHMRSHTNARKYAETYPDRPYVQAFVGRDAFESHRLLTDEAELLMKPKDVLFQALQIVPLLVMRRYGVA